MTISFYNCTDDSVVVNKTLVSPLTLTGYLREATSIMEPVISIEAETLVGKNYAYISEFGRYYFITDIVSEVNGLWRVSMKVDVLMSFKDQFLLLQAIVGRNEERFNHYITDGKVVTRADPIIITKRFPGNHFLKNNLVLAVAGNRGMTGDYISQLIAVATGEEGYLEKATNANLDSKRANPGNGNYTKYGRDMDAEAYFAGIAQAAPWCSTFANWCFWKAFGKGNALATLYEPALDNLALSTSAWRGYFDNNDAIVSTPQRGDIAFFDWDYSGDVDHCGIVYQVDLENGVFFTIEGNTLPEDASSTYEGVYIRKRFINSQASRGFGRPDWSAIS